MPKAGKQAKTLATVKMALALKEADTPTTHIWDEWHLVRYKCQGRGDWIELAIEPLAPPWCSRCRKRCKRVTTPAAPPSPWQ